MKANRIKIDGEIYHIENVREINTELCEIETDSGEEFILAESSKDAGEYSREYWKDLAENDKSEFVCMVGEETLVSWALGEYAGPGSTQVCSLEDWLDLWLDTPEEHLSSYDGCERQVDRIGRGAEEIGFTPEVAYRCN